MIKTEYIKVFNIKGAFRGLRNPLSSWEKSDSHYCDGECKMCIHSVFDDSDEYPYYKCTYPTQTIDIQFPITKSNEIFVLGEKDINLAQNMLMGGTDESKFMRQIFVSMDITAPDYFFKELSTYKVATVENSTSTMHRIMSKYFDYSMFSCDGMRGYNVEEDTHNEFKEFQKIIDKLNELRDEYLITKDKEVWKTLISILPMNYLYKRTWTGNYQVLRNMYFARKNHKLSEWVDFCKVIESLPYAKELICFDTKQKG